MGFYPARTATPDPAVSGYLLELSGAGLILPVPPGWWGTQHFNSNSRGPVLANAWQFDGVTGDFIGGQSYGFSPGDFAYYDGFSGADPGFGSEFPVYTFGTYFASVDKTVWPNTDLDVQYVFGSFGPFTGGSQAAAVTADQSVIVPLGMLVDVFSFLDPLIPASSSLAVPAAIGVGNFVVTGVSNWAAGLRMTVAGLSMVKCWDVETPDIMQVQAHSNCIDGLTNYTIWSGDHLGTFEPYFTRWTEQSLAGAFDYESFDPEFDLPALTALLQIENVFYNISHGPLGFLIPITNGADMQAVLVSKDWTTYAFVVISALDAEAQAILDYAAANPFTLSLAQDDDGNVYCVAGNDGDAPTLATGNLVPLSGSVFIPPPDIYLLPCNNYCYTPFYLE